MSQKGITRRETLSGIGASGTGLLAGCLGGSRDNELHTLTDLSSEEW